MERFFYEVSGLTIYAFGFVPFSGYLGYYSLNTWHQKWGENISSRKP